jgi:hypothetical protein
MPLIYSIIILPLAFCPLPFAFSCSLFTFAFTSGLVMITAYSQKETERTGHAKR